MLNNPIYQPKGAALEYAACGLNIYDSCSHGCTYCYARERADQPWASTVSPRPGILEATEKQLARPAWRKAGRLIHLCFTCDPYPVGHDSGITREIIKAIKASGNHVQILTKGDHTAQRDFDLLDKNDWFGITLTGHEHYINNGGHYIHKLNNINRAYYQGINTWVSCEPVLDAADILGYIKYLNCVSLWRIGKLNHQPSDIDWRAFGHAAEALCKKMGLSYYIKEALRKEMEKPHE